jgi:hypothetical protein
MQDQELYWLCGCSSCGAAAAQHRLPVALLGVWRGLAFASEQMQATWQWDSLHAGA